MKDKFLNIRIEPDFFRQLTLLAGRQSCTVSQLVRRFIEDGVSNVFAADPASGDRTGFEQTQEIAKLERELGRRIKDLAGFFATEELQGKRRVRK